VRAASTLLAAAAVTLAPGPPASAQLRIPKPPASCQEYVPPSATRPKLEETFPERTFSGYATDLVVTVTHGKGETVLPEGFRVHTGSDAAKALAFAGFAIPEPDGGVGPALETETAESSAVTRLRIPFVALPGAPGKVTMELPPVPIAVARASGELMTLCTSPHRIQVDEPVANLQNPRVAPNPEPRSQREEWLAAKQALAVALLLTLLALVVFFLVRRELRKPKAERAATPRLPWLVALEELAALRAGTLLAEGRKAELYDHASDCVRGYLGARYGVGGLETTSDEMMSLLRRVRPPVAELASIAAFLADCDMVKFARLEPTEADCRAALDRGEAIVRATTPPQHQPGAAPGAPAGSAAAPPGPTAPPAPIPGAPGSMPGTMDPYAAPPAGQPAAGAAPAAGSAAVSGSAAAVPAELGAPPGAASAPLSSHAAPVTGSTPPTEPPREGSP
jgi:hypothetical protein